MIDKKKKNTWNAVKISVNLDISRCKCFKKETINSIGLYLKFEYVIDEKFSIKSRRALIYFINWIKINQKKKLGVKNFLYYWKT